MIFFLFVDIAFGVYRIFKKKQGLYYWCMLLGPWGCIVNTIAIVLKYLLPNSDRLWPLYTPFMVGGWTIYFPAQLLALYSRLHLINQNYDLQRRVLIMIIVVAVLIIIPTWFLAWHAFNPYDRHISSLYSPRKAIMDRCSQIACTFTETVISSIYIRSLSKLLKLKPSVRQRRVLTDLIYVNIIAIFLDVVVVVLVFFDQLGIGRSIQTFSYILKLKLEFVALNQLMAVAARGIQKESFAERRYHHPSTSGEKDYLGASSKKSRQELSKQDSVKELVLPSPTLSKVQGAHDSSSPHSNDDATDRGTQSMKAKLKKRGTNDVGGHVEEDDDEEIGVHMWEKRGRLVMEVPWLQNGG